MRDWSGISSADRRSGRPVPLQCSSSEWMPSQTACGRRRLDATAAPRWQRVSIRVSAIWPPFCMMLKIARRRSDNPLFTPVCEKTKPSTLGRLSLTALKSRLKPMSSDR